jgi:hypothetical protein
MKRSSIISLNKFIQEQNLVLSFGNVFDNNTTIRFTDFNKIMESIDSVFLDNLDDQYEPNKQGRFIENLRSEVIIHYLSQKKFF